MPEPDRVTQPNAEWTNTKNRILELYNELRTRVYGPHVLDQLADNHPHSIIIDTDNEGQPRIYPVYLSHDSRREGMYGMAVALSSDNTLGAYRATIEPNDSSTLNVNFGGLFAKYIRFHTLVNYDAKMKGGPANILEALERLQEVAQNMHGIVALCITENDFRRGSIYGYTHLGLTNPTQVLDFYKNGFNAALRTSFS